MSDLRRQREELYALRAIYGNIVDCEQNPDSQSVRFELTSNVLSVQLLATLPLDYPSLAPPIFELSSPDLNGDQKGELCDELQQILLENLGEPVLFAWVEAIREFIQNWASGERRSIGGGGANSSADVVEIVDAMRAAQNDDVEGPEIVSGTPIIDRKSTFQLFLGARFASLVKKDVDRVLNKLLENGKIARATHNIYAYRIVIEKNGLTLKDCEDDGEIHAGGRLMHLLEMMDVQNALVVVTRWYGGIHLGPDRYKHICNAARDLIQEQNLCPAHTTGNKAGPSSGKHKSRKKKAL